FMACSDCFLQFLLCCAICYLQFYLLFSFLPIRRPPRSTLFPYTTLFRSHHLKQSDIFMMLSKPGANGDVEGFGIAILEANAMGVDRKSTRLNSSHVKISYAVFCLKKKKQIKKPYRLNPYKHIQTSTRKPC